MVSVIPVSSVTFLSWLLYISAISLVVVASSAALSSL